eukprot:1153035-Pelagomonas_calceolata.AAC.11
MHTARGLALDAAVGTARHAACGSMHDAFVLKAPCTRQGVSALGAVVGTTRHAACQSVHDALTCTHGRAWLKRHRSFPLALLLGRALCLVI